MAAPWREQQQHWASPPVAPPLYRNTAPAVANAPETDSASVNSLYATGGVAGGQQQQQRQGAAAQVFRMPPPPSQQQQALIADSARQQYERLRQQRSSQVRRNAMMSPVAANAPPGVAQAQQMQSQLQQLQAQRLAHMNQLKQQEQRRLQQQQEQNRLEQQRTLQQRRQLQQQQQLRQQQQQQIRPQQPQQQQQEYQWNEASSTANAYNDYQQQQGQEQMQQTQQQQDTQRKELQRQQRQQKKQQRQLKLQQKKQQQLQFQQQQLQPQPQPQQQQQQQQLQQYQPLLQQYERQEQQQQRAIPSGMSANKVTHQQQPRHLRQQQSQPRQQSQQQQLHAQPQQQQYQQRQIQPQQQQYQRQQQQKLSRMNAKKAPQQSQPQQLQQSQQLQVSQQQQQFQRAFQFLDSEIRESANSGNTSDSSGTGQRSSTVIQPGVAIVPPHYRDQIPMEMPALPRLGPPSFHFSFAQSHAPGYSGSSYGGYPGSEYTNGGGAQNNGSTTSSHLQSPPMQTTTSAPVTFVAFGAPSDGWMLPFTDYNDSNDNSNNNSRVPVENHFEQATWNREQHYSPAASAINPSFNASDPGHQPSNVFSEPHRMMSLQQQQQEEEEENRQQQQHNPATMAAAKALFGLQSPVNSPRWNEVNAEVSNANPWLQTQSRATSTLKKGKVKKASTEFALSRIVNPLEMSVEDQNKELMNAAESTVDGDFLDVLARSAGYDSDAVAAQPALVQCVPLLVPVRPPPRQEAALQQFSTGYFGSNGQVNSVGTRGGTDALAPSHVVQSDRKAVAVPPAKEEPRKKGPVKRKRVNDTVTVQERQIQMPIPALSTTLGLSLDEGWVVPEPISKKKVCKPRVKAVKKPKASSNEPAPPAASAETTVNKKPVPAKRRKKQEETIALSNQKPQVPPILSAAATVQPPEPNRVLAPNPLAPVFARPPDGQLNASRLPAATMVMPTALHAVRSLMNPVETVGVHREGAQPPMSLAVGTAPATSFGSIYRPPETALQVVTTAGKKKKADSAVPKQSKAKQLSAKRRNAQGTAPAAKGSKTNRKRKSDATPATGSQLSSNLNDTVQSGVSGNICDNVKEAMESLMTEATAVNNRFLAFNQAPLPGSMQVSSMAGVPSVVTSSYERMIMGNGGVRPTASEKNAATADPQAPSATVKDLVSSSNAPRMIDLTAADKSSAQISTESSLKASTPLAKLAVEVAFAGIQPEAATPGSLLEQLQSLNAPPPVSSEPNNTIMIFCKRDFMRYQAARLWKKYQEKKKMEFQSVQVLGKRTRFVNAKYEEEKLAKLQKKAKASKKIRKGKSVESYEDSLSSSPSVLEQVDAESVQSSNVKPAKPTQISGLQSSNEVRPSNKMAADEDEAPAVETKQSPGSEIIPAAAALIVRPTGGVSLSVESAQQDPPDAVLAENSPILKAIEQTSPVTSVAEALSATPLEQLASVVPDAEASLVSHAVEASGEISTEEDLSSKNHIAAPSEEALSVLPIVDAPVSTATLTAETEASSVTPTAEAAGVALTSPALTDEASIAPVTLDNVPVPTPTIDGSSEQPRVVRSALEALEAAIVTLVKKRPSVTTTEQSSVEPLAQEALSVSEEDAHVLTPLAHTSPATSPEKLTDVEVPAADTTVVPLAAKILSGIPSAEVSLASATEQLHSVELVVETEVTSPMEQDQNVSDTPAEHAPEKLSSTAQAAPVETSLDEVSSLAPAEEESFTTPQSTEDSAAKSTAEVVPRAELSIAVSREIGPVVLSVAEAQDGMSTEETSNLMPSQQVQVAVPAPEELEAAEATPVELLPRVTPSNQTHDMEPAAGAQVTLIPTDQARTVNDASTERALREASTASQSAPAKTSPAVDTSSVVIVERPLAASLVVEDPVIVFSEDASSDAQLAIAAPTAEAPTTLSAAEAHSEVSTGEAPNLTESEQSSVMTLAGEAPAASPAKPSEQCSSVMLNAQPLSPAYEPPSETPPASEEITQVEMGSDETTMVLLTPETSSMTPIAEPSSVTPTVQSQDAISEDEYQMVPVLELDQSGKEPNAGASLLAPDMPVQMSDVGPERAPNDIPAPAATPPAETQDAMPTAHPVETPVAKPAEVESPSVKSAEVVPATVIASGEAPRIESPIVEAPRTPTEDWSVTPTSDFSSPEPAEQAPSPILALEAPSGRLFERSALIAQAFSSNSIARAPATQTEKPREVEPIAKKPSPAPRAQAPVARQPTEASSAVVTSMHTQILILRPDASIMVAPSGQVSSAISAARALRVASAAATKYSGVIQGDESVSPSLTRVDEASAMTRAARRQAPREELIWISACAQSIDIPPRNTAPPSDEVMNAPPTDQAASNDVGMSSVQAPTASLVSETRMQFERTLSVVLTESVAVEQVSSGVVEPLTALISREEIKPAEAVLDDMMSLRR